jgi:SNF2 family DNA or RNA helicase
MNLDKYQQDAVSWLLGRPRAMLAWEMGVGKTAPLIQAWEQTRCRGPLLVMCLASARENWRREIKTCTTMPAKVQVFYGQDPMDPESDIVICNYDKLLNIYIRSRLTGRKWGTLVLDEAHALKTPNAKRTRHVYGPMPKHQGSILTDRAEQVWLATGTPMPNHPGELYTHASRLWPERMQYNGHTMAQWEFEAGFCEIEQTPFGPRIIGARNLEELKARLGPVISVLKRRDVLDLPPLISTSWPLDCEITGGSSPIPDLPELLGSLVKEYGSPGNIDRFDKATLSTYLAKIEAHAGSLAAIRRQTSVLKAIRAGLTLNEELDCGAPKTVVFAWHREALAKLERILAEHKPAVIHGDIEGAKRQDQIDRFQNDPRCRVFLGQITAAGSSINLQAGSNVVFVESSWAPGDNDQALSRVYRRGQKSKVYVRFCYLAGTIDELVQRALARKTAMISQMF